MTLGTSAAMARRTARPQSLDIFSVHQNPVLNPESVLKTCSETLLARGPQVRQPQGRGGQGDSGGAGGPPVRLQLPPHQLVPELQGRLPHAGRLQGVGALDPEPYFSGP